MTDTEARVQELCDLLVEKLRYDAHRLFVVPEYLRTRHLTAAHADTLIEAHRLIARVLMPLVENETQPRKETHDDEI